MDRDLSKYFRNIAARRHKNTYTMRSPFGSFDPYEAEDAEDKDVGVDSAGAKKGDQRSGGPDPCFAYSAAEEAVLGDDSNFEYAPPDVTESGAAFLTGLRKESDFAARCGGARSQEEGAAKRNPKQVNRTVLPSLVPRTAEPDDGDGDSSTTDFGNSGNDKPYYFGARGKKLFKTHMESFLGGVHSKSTRAALADDELWTPRQRYLRDSLEERVTPEPLAIRGRINPVAAAGPGVDPEAAAASKKTRGIFNLGSKGIGSARLGPLAHLLPEVPALDEVDLSGNRIHDVAAMLGVHTQPRLAARQSATSRARRARRRAVKRKIRVNEEAKTVEAWRVRHFGEDSDEAFEESDGEEVAEGKTQDGAGQASRKTKAEEEAPAQFKLPLSRVLDALALGQRSLRVLNLSDNVVSRQAMRTLGAAMLDGRGFPMLETLRLSRCRLTDDHIPTSVALALATSKAPLSVLDLSYNEFARGAVFRLVFLAPTVTRKQKASASRRARTVKVQAWPHLTELCLSGNHLLSERDRAVLLRALNPDSPTGCLAKRLRTLRVSDIHFGRNVLAGRGDALLRILRRRRLAGSANAGDSSNPEDDGVAGASAESAIEPPLRDALVELGHALAAGDTSLQALEMRSAFLGDRFDDEADNAWDVFCAGMSENTSLLWLDLSHNQLSVERTITLGDRLLLNHTLTDLFYRHGNCGRVDNLGFLLPARVMCPSNAHEDDPSGRNAKGFENDASNKPRHFEDPGGGDSNRDWPWRGGGWTEVLFSWTPGISGSGAGGEGVYLRLGADRWDPYPMVWNTTKGAWEAWRALAPGRYKYLFQIGDGTPDPNDEEEFEPADDGDGGKAEKHTEADEAEPEEGFVEEVDGVVQFPRPKKGDDEHGQKLPPGDPRHADMRSFEFAEEQPQVPLLDFVGAEEGAEQDSEGGRGLFGSWTVQQLLVNVISVPATVHTIAVPGHITNTSFGQAQPRPAVAYSRRVFDEDEFKGRPTPPFALSEEADDSENGNVKKKKKKAGLVASVFAPRRARANASDAYYDTPERVARAATADEKRMCRAEGLKQLVPFDQVSAVKELLREHYGLICHCHRWYSSFGTGSLYAMKMGVFRMFLGVIGVIDDKNTDSRNAPADVATKTDEGEAKPPCSYESQLSENDVVMIFQQAETSKWARKAGDKSNSVGKALDRFEFAEALVRVAMKSFCHQPKEADKKTPTASEALRALLIECVEPRADRSSGNAFRQKFLYISGVDSLLRKRMHLLKSVFHHFAALFSHGSGRTTLSLKEWDMLVKSAMRFVPKTKQSAEETVAKIALDLFAGAKQSAEPERDKSPETSPLVSPTAGKGQSPGGLSPGGVMSFSPPLSPMGSDSGGEDNSGGGGLFSLDGAGGMFGADGGMDDMMEEGDAWAEVAEEHEELEAAPAFEMPDPEEDAEAHAAVQRAINSIQNTFRRKIANMRARKARIAKQARLRMLREASEPLEASKGGALDAAPAGAFQRRSSLRSDVLLVSKQVREEQDAMLDTAENRSDTMIGGLTDLDVRQAFSFSQMLRTDELVDDTKDNITYVDFLEGLVRLAQIISQTNTDTKMGRDDSEEGESEQEGESKPKDVPLTYYDADGVLRMEKKTHWGEYEDVGMTELEREEKRIEAEMTHLARLEFVLDKVCSLNETMRSSDD